MRKIRSFRCPTCGTTYFNHIEWRECYGCSYDRNVARPRAMAAHPAGKGRVSDPSAKV